jgi:hypothetical protein
MFLSACLIMPVASFGLCPRWSKSFLAFFFVRLRSFFASHCSLNEIGSIFICHIISLLEQDIGFEPMTFSLATKHSTTELILHLLLIHYTADDSARQIKLHACMICICLLHNLQQTHLVSQREQHCTYL